MTTDLLSETILVTGGAGFIGGALVRALLQHTQATVVNVDKLTYAGNLESLADLRDHPRHRFFQADIADERALRDIFLDTRPASVMHLAAESHVDRSIDSPGDFIETNVTGTYRLLHETLRHWRGLSRPAAAAFRFLHVSTDEVFGSLGDDGYFTEETSYQPNSPYSASKAASDHLVRAWHHTYGLPTLISNCSNNYGPYQFPEKLIPLVVTKAVRGEPIPVYGAGTNVRDWLFVEDHVRALITILVKGTPGRTYNVGGRAERTNLQVVREICRLIDDALGGEGAPRSSLIEFVADRPGHDLRYAIDPSRIESELGWRAEESFGSGLARTVDWYLANPEWMSRVQSGAYRGERLGLSV